MKIDFTGRVVLITGASGGIGAAIAEAFAEAGAKLVLHHRSGEAKAVAQALQRKNADFAWIQADLRNEGDVARLFEQGRKRYGGIDHLIANAGKYNPAVSPVIDMNLAQWEETLGNNLTATFLTVREFLRSARATEMKTPPSIVLLGSTAGLVGEANHADYAAAKSALIQGFAKTLKNEIIRLHPRARINVVSPGWTLTPAAKTKLKDEKAVKRVLQTIALRKLAKPEDVARAALFLAHEDFSGHMSGENLVVSGGMEGRVLFESAEISTDGLL